MARPVRTGVNLTYGWLRRRYRCLERPERGRPDSPAVTGVQRVRAGGAVHADQWRGNLRGGTYRSPQSAPIGRSQTLTGLRLPVSRRAASRGSRGGDVASVREPRFFPLG